VRRVRARRPDRRAQPRRHRRGDRSLPGHGDGDDALSLLYLDLDGFKQDQRPPTPPPRRGAQQAVTRIQGELRRNSDLVGRIAATNSSSRWPLGPTDLAASQLAPTSSRACASPSSWATALSWRWA